MQATVALAKKPVSEDCWRGFNPGHWQTSIDVRGFIVSNVTPYDGDEKFLAGPTERTKAVWAKLQPYFKEEQKKGVLAVDAKTPSDAAGAQGRLHRPGQRSDRRPADRSAVQARDLPVRRAAHGRGGPEGGRVRGRSAGPRGVHQVSQDPQRRRVRRLHAGDHAVPQVRHHHRPAGRLWPRPHHRRLPPRRALRRRSPDRGQEGGARADRRHVADRRGDPACARSSPSRSAR